MELIVVEAFVFVPEVGAFLSGHVQGGGDVEEVHEELPAEGLVGDVLTGQFKGDEEHVEGKHGHPAGAVALHEVTAIGGRLAAVEGAGIVEAEETAAKDFELVVGGGVVGPPSEVDEKCVKDVLEEEPVGASGAAGIGEVGAECGPGINGRVRVAEVPLVSGEASVGMHIPFLEQELELVLGQRGIGEGERDGVKGEVPAGEPRVFPVVGHGDDVVGDEVAPLEVARVGAVGRREGGVAVEPFADVVVVEHFVPIQAGEGLLLDLPLCGIEGGRGDGVIIFGALAAPGGHHLAEIHPARGPRRAESHFQSGRGARGEVEMVNGGGFGSDFRRIDCPLLAADEVAMKGILGERRGVRRAEEERVVGFVFGEKEFPRSGALQQPCAERFVLSREECGG